MQYKLRYSAIFGLTIARSFRLMDRPTFKSSKCLSNILVSRVKLTRGWPVAYTNIKLIEDIIRTARA